MMADVFSAKTFDEWRHLTYNNHGYAYRFGEMVMHRTSDLHGRQVYTVGVGGFL